MEEENGKRGELVKRRGKGKPGVGVGTLVIQHTSSLYIWLA